MISEVLTDQTSRGPGVVEDVQDTPEEHAVDMVSEALDFEDEKKLKDIFQNVIR